MGEVDEMDLREQLARIDRAQAETQKLLEEGRKLAAEEHMLATEQHKFAAEPIAGVTSILRLVGELP